MSERTARRGLVLILLVYLIAGTVYSLLAPLGEAPDEMDHFRYLRYIVEQRRLPRTAEDRLAISRKSHEPPLYYILLGAATSWVDTRPLSQIKILDPNRAPRHSLPDEVLIDFAPLHTADEQWPFRGVVLAWHLARLGSLLLMAGTLWVLFQIGREVVPRRPEVALLATAVAALTPQFVYIGASLNNDCLAALLGALVLWLLLRLAAGQNRWRDFALLGLLLGLARLTKFYALALLPEVALVLLFVAWRRRQARYLGGLALALGLAFAIPAPWLLYIQPANPAVLQGSGRLLVLFDVVHTERWFTPAGEAQTAGLPGIAGALLGILHLEPGRWAALLFRSFWGTFGAMTVAAPSAVYGVGAALSGLSLAGWLRILGQRLRRRPTVLGDARNLWIPGLQALAYLGTEAVFYGIMKRLPDTAQARHLYPALAGLALFLAVGWWALWPRLTSAPAIAGLAVLLMGLTGCSLPVVLHSMHLPPLPVRSTPWPNAPQPGLNLDLGDGLLLEGVRWQTSTPGELAGTLFWRAVQPPATETVIILELVDSSGAVRAVWAGHPGGSRYPTEAWDAGDHVRQDLRWPLPSPYPSGPLAVRLRVQREGEEVAALTLPAVTLPAGTGANAPTSAGEPACRIYGLASASASLRDTVLVTWPGQRPIGFAGPDGELWRPLASTTRGDQIALVVDPRLKPGYYILQAEGTLPAGPSPLVVTIAGRLRTFTVPEGLRPAGAVLGGAIELVGYNVESRVVPGGILHLRLVWRARQRIGQHYTVFTHLIDEQGRQWGQQDKLPGQDYSTLFWAPGEVVVDDYTIPVSPSAPAGHYQLAVGLYQALSGKRAPVTDAQDRSLGDQVLIHVQ